MYKESTHEAEIKVVWLVKLTRIKLIAYIPKVVDTAEAVFSSIEKAEEWLRDNYFVCGFHPSFKKPASSYWFHLHDTERDHIEVSIKMHRVDQERMPDFAYFR